MNEPFDVQSQLDAELDSGERIAWQAQGQAFPFSGRTLFPVIFVLLWLGFVSSIFITKGHGRNVHAAPPFFFLPFLIVGLLAVVAPLLRLRTGGRTYYLITNRRALIVTLGSSKRVLSYYPDKLQSLERRERKDGRGDIVIERMGIGSGNYRSQYLQDIGFMNIPDVKNVEGMLRDLATKDAGGKR